MQKRILYSVFTVHLLALIWVLLLNSPNYVQYLFNSAIEGIKTLDKSGIELIFEGDSLTKWNSNKPLLSLKEVTTNKGLVLTTNSLAYIHSKEIDGAKTTIKYSVVAQFYPIENQFLDDADLLDNFHLSVKTFSKESPQININGKQLYIQYNGQLPYWIYLITLLSLGLLLFLKIKKRTFYIFVVVTLVLTIGAYFTPLNGFVLGKASIYAQSAIIPNLFRLIISLNIYFTILALISRQHLKNIYGWIIVGSHGFILSIVLKSIINNSKITLDLFNHSTTILLSVCLLGIIGAFTLILFNILKGLLEQKALRFYPLLIILIGIQALGYALNFYDVLVVGWSTILGILYFLLKCFKLSNKAIQLSVFIWVLFSVCFVYLHYDLKRNSNNESYLAQQIAEETDPFLGFNVERIEKNQNGIARTILTRDTLAFLENKLFGKRYSEYLISTDKEGLKPLYTLNFKGTTYYIYPKTYNYFKGFPQLLQNDKWYNHMSGRIYFARYYQNSLLQTNSPDFFPINLAQNHLDQKKSAAIKSVQNQEKTYTALVYVKHSPLEYSLAIIILIAAFLFVLFIFWHFDILKLNLNLKQKIQLSIFGIAILTLTLCSSIAFYQLKKANTASNLSALKEKAQSVQIELEHKLSKESGKSLLEIQSS